MNCVLRIFVAIFSLCWPIKSAIGVRLGRNFVYSPQIHSFDDPENFSLIGPASLAVHFQIGNKNTYYVFLLPFSACIGHRCQIGKKFSEECSFHPFDDPENFSSIGPASLTVHFQSGNKNT